MKSVVLKIQLCAIALLATAGFLSNPDFYLWSLAPLAFLPIAHGALGTTASKRLLLLAYVSTALVSFIVGLVFFGDNALTAPASD